ncbi:MAG: ATP synthase F1 subunit gamma [Bacteroidota bacterium]
MASLKELRTRIKSVISTRQITSAMKMVAAARLRRAQDAVIRIRPYANKLQEILFNIAGDFEICQDNIFSTQREIKKVLLVAISSNRGLCGGFNSNVIKKTIALANEKYPQQLAAGNVQIYVIGKKAEDVLKKKYKITDKRHDLLDNLEFNNISQFAINIMKKFANHEFDVVDIIYNKFKNAAVQIISADRFLPINIEAENKSNSNYDYIFEPTKKQIIEELIPRLLKTQFFKVLLDSNAAEQGARMTAMHKATDNATTLLGDLRLSYNKARQDSITKEILEIVSGAEALKG